jgi:quinol monooxygenase YgiN
MTAPTGEAAFFTVTYVEVGPVVAHQGAALLRQFRDTSRQAAGVIRLDVLQRLDRPNQFTVLAAWTDTDSFDAHVSSGAAADLETRLSPILAAPSDTRQHHALAVGGEAPGTRQILAAVTHVDVVPPHKDDGVAALARLAEESRRHAGNLRFDVWQQTNRLNHCTVVEAWASREAFDAHVMAPETRAFRRQLAVMTGALYDERLYEVLS